MAQNSMDLFSLLPTSTTTTLESFEAYHPSWPPNASTFPLCRALPVSPSPPSRTLPSATNASATRATGGQQQHQRDVVDGAIATRATTPAVLLGREGGGGHKSADVVLSGQEGSGIRL